MAGGRERRGEERREGGRESDDEEGGEERATTRTVKTRRKAGACRVESHAPCGWLARGIGEVAGVGDGEDLEVQYSVRMSAGSTGTILSAGECSADGARCRGRRDERGGVQRRERTRGQT
jgi:hypothetical protein